MLFLRGKKFPLKISLQMQMGTFFIKFCNSISNDLPHKYEIWMIYYHVLQFSWRWLTCFGRKWDDDAVPFKKITGSFALLKWWRINFWGLCHAGSVVRRPVIASCCGSRFFLGNSVQSAHCSINSIMWQIHSKHFHFSKFLLIRCFHSVMLFEKS